jgi:hypothetical protein
MRAVEGGFPHSEICGSKVVRTSPQLIAAYHVLHRLLQPRHPPNALKALDRSHDQCPLMKLTADHYQKDQLLPNNPIMVLFEDNQITTGLLSLYDFICPIPP